MKSAHKTETATPAPKSEGLAGVFENLDRALARLETAIDRKISTVQEAKQEPQLELSNDREINKKIATRLDQTINRLETILSQEH